MMEVEEHKKRKGDEDNNVVLEEVLKNFADSTSGLLKLIQIMGAKVVALESIANKKTE